jgi:hypothetical protein
MLACWKESTVPGYRAARVETMKLHVCVADGRGLEVGRLRSIRA